MALTGAMSPFAQVEWSLSFVSFLAYIFTIVSYRIPIGTETMVIALLGLPLEGRTLRFPPLLAWACVFLAWIAVGIPLSGYPATASDAVLEFAKVCGVIFVAVNVLTSRARIRCALVTLVIIFGAYPVRGALLSYVGGGTMAGRAVWNYTYANPNDLAAMCMLLLAISLGVLETEKKAWVVWGTRLSVSLLCLVIVLTQSRGALIGLAVLLLIGFRSYWKDVRKILTALALAGFVFALAPGSVWKRFSTVFEVTKSEDTRAALALDQGSGRQRLEIWKVARTIIAEHPVTGVGFGAYGKAHFVYAFRSQFDPIARGPRDTHSTYLKLLAETGVPGLAIFCALIVSTVRQARRARRRAREAAPDRAMQLFYLEIGLYGFFVAGIWGSYAALVLTYLYLAIMTSAAYLIEEELSRMRHAIPQPARAPAGQRRRPVSPTRA